MNMKFLLMVKHSHCVKRVCLWSYSGQNFPIIGLNTQRYGVSLRIQSECGKYGPQKLRIRTLFTQCLGQLSNLMLISYFYNAQA